jgi:hypothetical protein
MALIYTTSTMSVNDIYSFSIFYSSSSYVVEMSITIGVFNNFRQTIHTQSEDAVLNKTFIFLNTYQQNDSLVNNNRVCEHLYSTFIHKFNEEIRRKKQKIKIGKKRKTFHRMGRHTHQPKKKNVRILCDLCVL